MLLPVHTPLRGLVISTVGGTVSEPGVGVGVGVELGFAMVTGRLAVVLAPAESVTVASNVTPPLGDVVVFQL
jgi:hypothetical protein